jgi:hypothetical protein
MKKCVPKENKDYYEESIHFLLWPVENTKSDWKKLCYKLHEQVRDKNIEKNVANM